MDAIYSTIRNEENITIGILIGIGVSFAQQYTCSANMNELRKFTRQSTRSHSQYAAYDDDDDEVLRVVPSRVVIE